MLETTAIIARFTAVVFNLRQKIKKAGSKIRGLGENMTWAITKKNKCKVAKDQCFKISKFRSGSQKLAKNQKKFNWKFRTVLASTCNLQSHKMKQNTKSFYFSFPLDDIRALYEYTKSIRIEVDSYQEIDLKHLGKKYGFSCLT